jgi:hypothetical protein
VSQACDLCRLERVLVARSQEIREALIAIGSGSRRYDALFAELVEVDRDLASMRGEVRR